jgi:hypothetical protein
MGSKNRRVGVLEATSVAVAWTFFVGDDFDVKRIALKWDSAPSASENVTVTLDSAQGAAYDTVLRSVDAIGHVDVVFENIDGLVSGDKLLVSYANTGTDSITGTAVMELNHG